MYIISVESNFDAAHHLREYGGRCERLHGHHYKVAAHLKVIKLNEVGIGYDFKELKNNLDKILEKYDHTYLNELPPFDRINPSTENIARTIYDELKVNLPQGMALESIAVWESTDAYATYRPD
jgi:6-pyruvoyltetrahydropterin/6-carboxytetrahydropterin synthase